MPYRRYGSRVGRFRARRRLAGKRKSYRRLSSRKPVTRRMLQRVIRPLKPEVKVIDYGNLYEMNIDFAPAAFSAECLNTVQPAQPGPITITTTNLSQPIPLTQIMRANVGNCRIGSKVRIKSIRVHLHMMVDNASAASKPFRVSIYVFRSKSLGQYYPGYIGAVGSGTMYPHAMGLAGADSPAWWYHQTSDLDSFSDPDNVIGPRRSACELVKRFTYLMDPAINDNDTAEQPYQMPTGGQTVRTVNFSVPISKTETVFNDNDASLSSGYFAYGHYWLTAIHEPDEGSATITVPVGDLRWRVLYTDA